MILYFQDGEYSITLEKAYQLWYYILFKWYDKDVQFTAPSLGIFYTIDNPISLDYTLSDIDLIQEEYDNLSYTDQDSGEKLRLFYKERVEDVFKQFQRTPIVYTQEEWTTIFKDNLGKDLIEYIDKRLTEIEVGSDISVEANKLLDEIYNSLVTWSVVSEDSDVNDYFHYFLDMLSFLVIQPEKTGTYRIMNFLKPFHVELTGQGRVLYRNMSKFNSAFFDHDHDFVMRMSKATLNNASHQLIKKLIIPSYNNLNIINDFYFIVNQYLEMVVPIINEYNSKMTDRRETIADQQHMLNGGLLYSINSSSEVISFANHIPIVHTSEIQENIHEFPVISNTNQFTMAHVHSEGFPIIIREANENLHILSYDDLIMKKLEDHIFEIKESLLFNLMFIKFTMGHISHYSPHKIKNLKKFSTLLSFIQGDTITKFFEDTSVVQQYRNYFNSDFFQSTLIGLESTCEFDIYVPPKFDNSNIDVGSEVIPKQRGDALLELFYTYSFDRDFVFKKEYNIEDHYVFYFPPEVIVGNFITLIDFSIIDKQYNKDPIEQFYIYEFEYGMSKATISLIQHRVMYNISIIGNTFHLNQDVWTGVRVPSIFSTDHIFAIDDTEGNVYLTEFDAAEHMFIIDQSSEGSSGFLINFDPVIKVGLESRELEMTHFYEFDRDFVLTTIVDPLQEVIFTVDMPPFYDELIVIEDGHRTGVFSEERQIITDYYGILPIHYTDQTDAVIGSVVSTNTEIRPKFDNCNINSYLHLIPIQNAPEVMNFISEFGFGPFEIERRTNLSTFSFVSLEIGLMPTFDNFHIFGNIESYLYGIKEITNIEHNKRFNSDLQKGSVVDIWNFVPFNWNAIYDSVGLNTKHHRQFRCGCPNPVEIEYSYRFDTNMPISRNVNFNHDRKWNLKWFHPVKFKDELVFTMNPISFSVDIDDIIKTGVWADINMELPQFNVQKIDGYKTWFYILSMFEDLRVSKFEESKIDLKFKYDKIQVFPSNNIFFTNDIFINNIVVANNINEAIISFGFPKVLQYGETNFDIEHESYAFTSDFIQRQVFEIEVLIQIEIPDITIELSHNFNMLADDSDFVLRDYIDLSSNFIHNIDLNIFLENQQVLSINTSNTDINVEKKHFSNLKIDTLKDKTNFYDKKVEEVNISEEIKFEDYILDFAMYSNISDLARPVSIPFISSIQGYIVNSDFSLVDNKQEDIEISENIIFDGQSLNESGMNISHNFNTIKI